MPTNNATNPANSNSSSTSSQDPSEHDTSDGKSRRLEGGKAWLRKITSETLLQVIIQVTPPSDDILYEYYREIFRSPDGRTYFGRVHHAVDSDRNLVTAEESVEQRPYITAEECSLERALERIKDFIPDHWRLESNSIEVLKCEPECREVWKSMKGEDDLTSDGLFPERLQFQAAET